MTIDINEYHHLIREYIELHNDILELHLNGLIKKIK